MNEDEKKSKAKDRNKNGNWKRTLGWVGGSLSVVLLLVAGVFGFLQTSPGRTMLASGISTLLSEGPHRQVVLGELGGLIPFSVRVDKVSVSDPEGEWLTIENVVFRWFPSALVRGRIHVEEIGASIVRLERLPPASAMEEPERSEPFALPERLPSVVIERLNVGEIAVGEAVVGQSAVFRVDGSVLKSEDDRRLSAALQVVRTDDGPATRADISVSVHGDPPMLQVRAQFREEAGGWAAAALGLEEAGTLTVALEGDGPQRDWKGNLDANMGALGSIRMATVMKVEEEIVLAFEGVYESAEDFVSPRLAPLLGYESRFAISVRLAPPHVVTLEGAELHGAGYRAQAAGRVDLEARTVAGDWNVGVDDISALEPLVGSPVSGKLAMRGTLCCDLDQPRGTISAQLSDVQTEEYSVGHVETSLRFESLEPAIPGSFQGLRITGTGIARELASLTARRLPESSLQWTLEMEAPVEEDISIKSLQVRGDHHLLELSGSFRAADLAGTVDAALQVEDLRPLTGYLGEERAGAGVLEIHLTGSGQERSATGRFQGRLRRLEGLPPALAAMADQEVAFAGGVDLREGSRFTVSPFRMGSPAFELTSEAVLDFSDMSLNGQWQLSIPQLQPFAAVIERPLTGSLRVEGSVAGLLDALEVTASLEATEVVVDGTEFPEVRANVEARDITQTPGGSLRLELRQRDESLDASAGFVLQERQLTLSSVVIEVPGSELKGDAVVDLEKSTVQGSVEGAFKDLAPLGRILGEPVEGSGELSARFSAGEERQDVNVVFKGRNLALRLGRVKEATLSADLGNVLGVPRGSVDAELKELHRPGLVLHTVSLRATGDAKEANFQGALSGRSTEDFALQAQGTLSRAEPTGEVRVSTLAGSFAEYPVRLLEPLVIQGSPEKFAFQRLALAVGDGRVQASGRLEPQRVLFDGDFEALPLEAAALFGGPDIQGSAAGRIRLTGEPGRPSADLTLRLTRVRSPETEAADMPAVALTAEGRIEAGRRFSVTAEMQGRGDTTASATLTLPVELAVQPFSFSVPPEGSLQGRLEARTDLSALMIFIPQEDHELSGPVTARFDVGGTVGSPQINGSAAVENGLYQNLAHGTVLRNLTMRLRAVERRLEIESARATDGERGTVTAGGWVLLDAARHFPVEIDLRLSNVTLIRRDDATASTRGELKISGSFNDLALTGRLDVRSAEILIRRRPSLEMVELDVIEIYGSGDPIVVREEPEETVDPEELREAVERSVFRMDIKVAAPGQVFIRGRGLDSEWRGDLHVTGSARGQAVTGALNVVRGHFDFMGERLRLGDGVIQFHGSIPPAPTINVNAESRVKDMTARLTVSGPVSFPEIQLRSEPELPQDEILARLLFDRNVTNLTPVQALRLADALRTLSGRGHALDFVGRTREFLGLHQLELRQSGQEGGGLAVGIGRYLTEDVYVDLEQGVGSDVGKASVRVEISPKITVETEAGSDASAAVGINLKYDY